MKVPPDIDKWADNERAVWIGTAAIYEALLGMVEAGAVHGVNVPFTRRPWDDLPVEVQMELGRMFAPSVLAMLLPVAGVNMAMDRRGL